MKAFEDHLEEAEQYCENCTTKQLNNIICDEKQRLKHFERKNEIAVASRAMLRAAKNELKRRT